MADTVVRKKTTRTAAKKSVARKAPTNIPTSSSAGGRSYVPLIAVGIFVLIVGVSVAVGFSDSGVIDVSSTITDRKNTATGDEQIRIQNVPVQQAKPRLPDGGLVPTNVEQQRAAAAPPPPTSSPEATSTEDMASSTAEADEEISEETSTEGIETDEAGDTTGTAGEAENATEEPAGA